MRIELTVVIPTYNRSAIVLETVGKLLNQHSLANEIILVDQSNYESGDPHYERLFALNEAGSIRWLRSSEPSIPKAMNSGLLLAQSEWVLFLDDDVDFDDDFISLHLAQITLNDALAHVGQVVQPWQHPNHRLDNYKRGNGLYEDLNFGFNSNKEYRIRNCMAGNLCVNREAAISAGGFDENFIGSAFRFETEFCKRFCEIHVTRFKYTPDPKLDHLYIKTGGTRAHANHLTSISSAHSMGDYYYALLLGQRLGRIAYIVRRVIFSLKAKFYLRRPWYMPIRLVAEFRGLLQAIRAVKKGQSLIKQGLEVEKK